MKTLKDYPNVREIINGTKDFDELSGDEKKIMTALNALDDRTLGVLVNYYTKVEPAIGDILSRSGSEELTRDSAMGTSYAPSVLPDREEGDKSEDEAKKRFAEGYSEHGKATWNMIHKVNDAESLENIFKRQWLGDKNLTPFDALHDYIVNNNIEIDFRTKPWPMIHKKYPVFVSKLKQGMRSFTGHGIRRGGCTKAQFLTSDPNALTKRLNILLGEYSAANNNVFEEISVICDELRRQGILNIKSIKKILSELISK